MVRFSIGWGGGGGGFSLSYRDEDNSAIPSHIKNILERPQKIRKIIICINKEQANKTERKDTKIERKTKRGERLRDKDIPEGGEQERMPRDVPSFRPRGHQEFSKLSLPISAQYCSRENHG
jgi:hypothetical protein